MEGTFKNAPLVAKITKTKRVVFGHTHRELHTAVDQIEVLNTGTWSPAFKDPECHQAFGRKCFAWIRPQKTEKEQLASQERVANLYVWNDPGIEAIKGGEMKAIQLSDIKKAENVLSKIIQPTPLIKNEWLSAIYGCEVYLKLETMQPVGSFKIRGASYRISQLNEAEKKIGVIAGKRWEIMLKVWRGVQGILARKP